jgi:glycosyltransferase involved in cell wall biosynthesis
MAGLRIAVVSDEGTEGGASIATTRLCIALRQAGHRVARIHHGRFRPHPDSADEFHPLELKEFSARALDNLPRNEVCRAELQRRWCRRFRRVLEEFRPHVVNLHNLHNARWDIEVVEECLRHAPVVWTLHDMWALTGSCAYAFECRRFERRCSSACPQVGTYPTLPAGMVAAAHARRRRLWSAHGGRLRFVAPSKWLAREARRATRLVPVRVIPYGLDLETFRPRNRAEARRWLGLPEDGRPVLMAGAAALGDRRKGMSDLLAAVGHLPEPLPRLVLIGHAGGLERPEGLEIRCVGPVTGERFLALALNAADLFVLPSHADNLPLVVQEALACGVPVVGYPTGGIPEMVRPGQTGWLAAEHSPAALAESLRQALEARAEWPGYAAGCRRVAESEYGAARQAARYGRLFRSGCA